MSVEDELLRLAREREDASDGALGRLLLEPPDTLRRQLRAYLGRQADHRRIAPGTYDKVLRLQTVQGGLNELSCEDLEFSSGVRLDFQIQLQQAQGGWCVKQFTFHVHLPKPRAISMVRIHLNPCASHDPLAVPRCHFHIGDSGAHIAFPIMNPRLILHLICEHIEPDLGLPPDKRRRAR
jgi:hypothetical protein